jgi:16S rRNA (guanine527-N7)-methyltransferase
MRVVPVLERARDLGFLGPRPVVTHVEHALGFAVAAGTAPTEAVDLGSGGGLPGLVLALHWPASGWVLVDASARRCAFLTEAVDELVLTDRVRVLEGRAEDVGRDGEHRGRYDLVVARSFAAPPVTAECAAPLLRVGGRLVVSEPPAGADRWPEAALRTLGLERGPLVTVPARYQVLTQAALCPARYPRRVGVPAKRPLF